MNQKHTETIQITLKTLSSDYKGSTSPASISGFIQESD